jgi:hypothetical protein
MAADDIEPLLGLLREARAELSLAGTPCDLPSEHKRWVKACATIAARIGAALEAGRSSVHLEPSWEYGGSNLKLERCTCGDPDWYSMGAPCGIHTDQPGSNK